MSSKIARKYDEVSIWYEDKYVDGSHENNPYRYADKVASQHFKDLGCKGKIVSLGCGSGQDIEIACYPEAELFQGYDISEGMLAHARRKFPEYCFFQHDCNQLIDTTADILMSVFGTPNYIGSKKILEHYKNMACKAAFFIFYNENYNDGVIEGYSRYSKRELNDIFAEYNPVVKELYNESNYYVVYWSNK